MPRSILDLTDFPTNEASFRRKFPDEHACRDWLRRCRWPKGFECDRCGGRRYDTIASRNMLECMKCRRQTSLTANTPFHKTRKPLRQWLSALYFLINERRRGRVPSAFALAPVINSAYGTARNCIRRLQPHIPTNL
jgi:hypothetical protein